MAPAIVQPSAPAIVQPPPSAEPQTRYLVAQQPTEKPLPALEVSDFTIRNALGELLSDKTLIDLFYLQDFVRRVVATVDNLPREKIAVRLMPLKPVGGQFLASGKGDGLAIGVDNALRYVLYLRLADAIDTGKLVALYFQFYPLFQQAYRELG